MLTTTLHAIREHDLCTDRWQHLLKGMGVTSANRKPLPLERILEICGLYDALWALQAVEGRDGAIRLYACYCARSVLDIFERNYPEDARPRQAIKIAERFAWGEATKEELEAARVAAKAAAMAARNAARDFPYITAWDAAVLKVTWVAAVVTSEDAPAAQAVAWTAAYDAAEATSEDAAWADIQQEFIRLCRLEGEYGEVENGRRYIC